MSLVRCAGCRGWFDATQPDCPKCHAGRPRLNRALRSAALNRNLYEQAEYTAGEGRRYRELVKKEIQDAKRYGVTPAPMRPSPLTTQERRLLA